MKKIAGSVIGVLLIFAAVAQQKSTIQPPTFGIHYFLSDDSSASQLRNSSLSATLANKNFGNFKSMNPGLAVSYTQGLDSKFDFSGMLAASVAPITLRDREIIGNDALNLEVDASIRGKMLTNDYWFVPYVQLGVGISKHAGYYGAFIPAGVGIQISFFDEAYFLINSQYRVPVTQTSPYRFFHSIGLAANLNSLK